MLSAVTRLTLREGWLAVQNVGYSTSSCAQAVKVEGGSVQEGSFMGKKKLSRRERRKRQHAARVRATRLRWAGVAALALLIVGGFLALGAFRSGGSSAAGPETVSAANVQGTADAPVQIVEFADFGCPSCRAWHNSGVKADLRSEFGDQISFTFRHFPVITRQSPKAAEAAQCAADQGAFWEYHDFLYEQAGPGLLGVEDLKRYAAGLGLDAETFNACLDAGRHKAYVEQDMQAAFDLGARGTPSFYVNGEPANLFSYEAAVSAIRQHLN